MCVYIYVYHDISTRPSTIHVNSWGLLTDKHSFVGTTLQVSVFFSHIHPLASNDLVWFGSWNNQSLSPCKYPNYTAMINNQFDIQFADTAMIPIWSISQCGYFKPHFQTNPFWTNIQYTVALYILQSVVYFLGVYTYIYIANKPASMTCGKSI